MIAWKSSFWALKIHRRIINGKNSPEKSRNLALYFYICWRMVVGWLLSWADVLPVALCPDAVEILCDNILPFILCMEDDDSQASRYTLKEQSNDLDILFSHQSNTAGPLTKVLNYVRFWFRFRRVIRIFRKLPGVSDPEGSISPGSQTPSSKVVILG